MFGKRAAAMAASKQAISSAEADFANTVRLRIAGTIAAYYDVLEMQAMLVLARENQDNLDKMEKIIHKRVALGGVGTIEEDRIKLSIFASHREVHARELDLASALSRLRALLGNTDNQTISVAGSLEVPAPAKPISMLFFYIKYRKI